MLKDGAIKSETDIVRGLLKRLEAMPGAHFWKNSTGVGRVGARRVRFGEPGSPDVIGVYLGRAVGFELKNKAGRNRDETTQPIFRKKWEEAGGVYIRAHSADEAVRELGRRVCA